MKFIKWILISMLLLCILAIGIIYVGLNSSLPKLDDNIRSSQIDADASLSRDTYGSAVIHAQTQGDAAYLLGYAHAQDRLFQMDLLRRQAAGELSEIIGQRAIELDKQYRIHQFRQRAQNTYQRLPAEHQRLLLKYTDGVNQAAQAYTVKPIEYLLSSSDFAPWLPEDSLLTIYSMYIDLQLGQTEKDFHLTALKEIFGEGMYQFFTLPSNFQSAIDYSVIEALGVEIPSGPATILSDQLSLSNVNFSDPKQTINNLLTSHQSVAELDDYGSNNWAVAGKLTSTTSAMLSNDMHLGLRVPAIWYRTQLNYIFKGQAVKVTGVSLPGTPAVIVGSNGHIAWGFTNSNVDNVDWIELADSTNTTTLNEQINTPEGALAFTFEMSEHGPVRYFNGVRYALKWVAHQDYAVNLDIADMAKVSDMHAGLALSKSVRIPVQNMVIADSQGNIAWQLTGAISGRTSDRRHAISEANVSPLWAQQKKQPANHINPANGRVWSANARVVGLDDLTRFGDGGYALGARQQQIMQRLMAQTKFTEQDFYAIQLDNRALFLMPWHNLLSNALTHNPQKYAQDLQYLNNWQACACEDSVGYTLVRHFRSTVINQLLAPIDQSLQTYGLSTSYLLSGIEPAIWAIIENQPQDWLPTKHVDYQGFLIGAYDTSKASLLANYSEDKQDLADLTWGSVNALRVDHPFAASVGIFSRFLNMSQVAGFGDSFMPAVQSRNFGASQRLIVRPGNEENAILTVAGGQSGNFLSPYFRIGFEQYATHQNTPLLPTNLQHTVRFKATHN